MKLVSTLAASSIAVGLLANTEISAEHVERQLILGGSTVPSGSKTYVTSIRETPGGDTFCVAALVSPKHVLTTGTCTAWGQSNYVSVGTHYINGTRDGEQIKVVAVQNHTDFNFTTGAYDFALLTLEKASKFTPARLPAADDSDIKPGMWASIMGWGETSYPKGTVSNELQKVGLEVWDNMDCSQVFLIDDTMVCAGGAAGRDSCGKDAGGPLVKERKQGDADDVVIGLSSWGDGCGTKDIPSVYARVSSAVDWIKSVIEGQ